MSLVPPSPTLMPGHRLDRYELLALIAEGGMGQVWLARMVGKHGFEKLVAVKTLLPKYAADLRFQQMFLDEARIASGIEHANVAQILDLGEQNDILYLVMELVDGEALSKLTRALTKAKQEFPIAIGLRIIADACGGLHVAHELRGADGSELGIVHRDISPQNILLSANGVAKIIDFGIAKARDRFAGETSEGILKGKIHYMAPEQALGRKMDRRADVFAFGAILYLLFSGRPAYDGESQLEVLHLLTSGRPPMPLPSTVPKPVSDVIRKALAADPAARFQTALEMQRAINKVMSECKLMADTSDVAAFTALHLADRTQKRRRAIELALKAATERASMNATLLSPPSAKSSPGTAVLPFGAVTPATQNAADVLVVEEPPPRAPSVSEVEAVATSQAQAATPKRRGAGRWLLVGVTALALAGGGAFVATRGTATSTRSDNGSPTSVAKTPTEPALPLPAPATSAQPAASASAQPAAAASTTIAHDDGTEHKGEAVAAATSHSGTARPGTHHAAPATTKSAQPVSAQGRSNVPDFGY